MSRTPTRSSCRRRLPRTTPKSSPPASAAFPVVPRALMLAELMRLKQGIAVAGTHGKTTTTSLVASVLAEGGLDPTFVIGGRLLSADANARLGKGEFLVAEADESDASFLYLTPVLAVVTNIDADHMETYEHDFAKLKRAFVDFLQRLPFYGVAVVCVDDANVRAILPDVTKPLVTYGLGDDADLRAVDVANVGGRMRFVARAKGAPGPRGRAGAARRAQRAQRARCDRGGPRGRRRRRRHREGAGRVPRRRPPLPAPWRRRDRRRRHVHADRRLRPPSGRDGAQRWRPRARAFPGGAWCSPSSRIATRARATCSRTSCACCPRPTRWCWPTSIPRARRRSSPPTAARLRAPSAWPARSSPCSSKTSPTCRRRCARSCATATSCVTMGAGSIGDCRRAAGAMIMHEPRHFTGLRGRLSRDAPLAKHTSWRTGGIADTLYLPADRDDLAMFIRQLPATEPVTVLGLGSNTLVRDGGIRGTVVVMHNPGATLAVSDGLVYADAGAASPKLARFAATHGCAEAEFLAGVPGTVGGALAMNAGCYGGETWRHVARVEVLTRDRRVRRAHAGRLRDRLPARAAARRQRDIHRGLVPFSARRWDRGARTDQGAPRAPDRDATPVAAQRGQRVPQPAKATTRRGSSSPAASRATPSAAHACRKCTPTSS